VVSITDVGEGIVQDGMGVFFSALIAGTCSVSTCPVPQAARINPPIVIRSKGSNVVGAINKCGFQFDSIELNRTNRIQNINQS
jgi:hypothetical protein